MLSDKNLAVSVPVDVKGWGLCAGQSSSSAAN